jgi:hypothetical protein
VGTLTDNIVTFNLANPQTVFGMKTYTIKANLSGSLLVGSNITTSIVQDINHIKSTSANDPTLNSSYLVWSDVSDYSHSTLTNDWTGSYLIRNLPMSQTLSR